MRSSFSAGEDQALALSSKLYTTCEIEKIFFSYSRVARLHLSMPLFCQGRRGSMGQSGLQGSPGLKVGN